MHTYKELKYKCEGCNSLVNDILSLDVHVGRKHSGNFECAIRDFKAKNEDNLNIHLHTCETFSCDYCWDPKITVNNLSDLVTHLKENSLHIYGAQKWTEIMLARYHSAWCAAYSLLKI